MLDFSLKLPFRLRDRVKSAMPDETPNRSESSAAETVSQVQELIRELEALLALMAAQPEANVELPPEFATLIANVAQLKTTLTTDEAAAAESAGTVAATAETIAPEIESRPETAPSTTTADATATTEDEWLPEAPSPEPEDAEEETDGLATVRQLGGTLWQALRGVLPESLSEQLSDGALAGILGGMLVVVLVIGTFALPSGEAPPPEAPAPPIAPSGATQPEPPAPTVTPPPAPQAPSPSRSLRLTPEQKLIAAIQEQVAQITDQYAEGLIQSLQVNFQAGRLRVLMGAGWYDLERDRQTQIANEVLARARQLDFAKVEMVDPQETLLARNPVVGDQMVIFQREAPTPTAAQP